MNLREKFSTLEHTGTDWRRLLLRGSIMLLIGLGLVLGTVFKHDVIIFQVRDFSWLPVCGFVVLTVGLLIWFEWPSSAGWFLAFCLSAEIALRGWAIMMFGFWVKAQKERESLSY